MRIGVRLGCGGLDEQKMWQSAAGEVVSSCGLPPFHPVGRMVYAVETGNQTLIHHQQRPPKSIPPVPGEVGTLRS